MRNRHPKKEVETVLQKAEAAGWSIVVPASHWGIMRCPCGECQQVSIWSTPRDPGNHAKALQRRIDKCPGPLMENETKATHRRGTKGEGPQMKGDQDTRTKGS